MKKKYLFLTLALSLLLFSAACGKNDVNTAASPSEVQHSTSQSTDSSSVEETSAEPVSQVNQDEQNVLDSNHQYTLLEDADPKDLTEFAESVKKCVMSKDITGLSELVAFPVYVDIGDGMVIQSKEDFTSLDSERLFTAELLSSMKDIDTSSLQISKAGITLGTGSSTITFGITDGTLGIKGINY